MASDRSPVLYLVLGQRLGGPDMKAEVFGIDPETNTVYLHVLETPGFTWGMLPGETYTLRLGLAGRYFVEGADPGFVVYLEEGEIRFRHFPQGRIED